MAPRGGHPMTDPYEEAYEKLKLELMPKTECRTCECGEMQLTGKISGMAWEYVCELDECYHTLEETVNE